METPRGLLLPGWCYRGPGPVLWGRILVCQSKQALTLLFLRRASRDPWWLGICEAGS